MVKTNAMRRLDSLKIQYKVYSYADTEAVSGTEVAAAMNQDPSQMFKTLVATGKSGGYYVFAIPVAEKLDLKKATLAAGEKSIEMLKSKDLLPLTGYVHGGCSPVGMKKVFRTFLHESADGLGAMFVSGGKIGYQIEVTPEDLRKAIPFDYADLIK